MNGIGTTAPRYRPQPKPPVEPKPECSRPECLRTAYMDGLCKRHKDEDDYLSGRLADDLSMVEADRILDARIAALRHAEHPDILL